MLSGILQFANFLWIRYAAPSRSANADTSPMLPPILPIERFKMEDVAPVSLRTCKGVAVETMSTGVNQGLIAVGKAKTRKSRPRSAGLKIFLGNPPNISFPNTIPTTEAAAKAYKGVDGETDNAKRSPVTAAPPSLNVYFFLKRY